MQQTTKRTKILTLALAAGVVGAAWAQASHLSLIVNGAVASSDVRVIGGRPYVPLSDMARADNKTLVKRPGGYELIAAGGAGEVGDAHTAGIGQELFTGKWRFQVLDIARTDAYTMRYDQDAKKITPQGADDELLVVHCRVKNGMAVKHDLGLGTGDYVGDTALTDDGEHAYPTYAVDVHHDKDYYDARGVAVLPGAAADLALVFSVPKGTRPKDLVYSLMLFDDIYMDTKHKTDVRVSLAP